MVGGYLVYLIGDIVYDHAGGVGAIRGAAVKIGLYRLYVRRNIGIGRIPSAVERLYGSDGGIELAPLLGDVVVKVVLAVGIFPYARLYGRNELANVKLAVEYAACVHHVGYHFFTGYERIGAFHYAPYPLRHSGLVVAGVLKVEPFIIVDLLRHVCVNVAAIHGVVA